MELHKGIVGIRIDRLKNASGNQDYEGCNPFFNVITPSGHRLSNYVTLFKSSYYSSEYVYKDIKEHIEDLIEDAINNRWNY